MKEHLCYWCSKPITDGTGQIVLLKQVEIRLMERGRYVGPGAGYSYAAVHEYCQTKHEEEKR